MRAAVRRCAGSRPPVAAALAAASAFGALAMLACGHVSSPSASVAATPAAAATSASRFAIGEIGVGLPRSGQWRHGFDLADMNGDGHLDVVSGPPRKGPRRPQVFLGDGRGTFRHWSEAHFPALDYDYGAAATGDLNGDGIADLVLACHLTGLTALLGEGRGVFSPYAEGLELRAAGAPAGPPSFSSRAVALADWNSDGRPDIVALAEGPTRGDLAPAPASPSGARRGLRVHINHSGAWEALAGDPAAAELFGDSLAVGDVDGDGRPDAVTASAAQGERRILHLGSDRGWSTVPLSGLRPGAFVWAVATADLDRDGRDDVAVSSTAAEDGAWRSVVDLLHSLPGPPGTAQTQAIHAEEGRRQLRALAFGDLDGDGALDLVAAADDGAVLTFAGDGAGRLIPDAVIAPPEWRRGCAAHAVRVADLDGDGAGEIVAAFAGERGLATGAVCPSGGGIQAWKVTAVVVPHAPR